MRYFYLNIILLCFVSNLRAQPYTIDDLEGQFLKRNGELLAVNYNVNIADAEVIQERLWQNPSFSIKEINFLKNYENEDKRFTLELEQLIETASKRKKRVVIKELSKKSALIDYEELLRELKKELNLAFNSLQRIYKEEQQLSNVVQLFETLSDQYQKQSNLNNVPKAEYFRIQTELISYQKELIDLENEKFEALNLIRIITFNPEIEFNQIIFSQSKEKLSLKVPFDFLQIAKEQNIGLLRQTNEINIASKSLELEKSERIPNFILGVNYDRGFNKVNSAIGLGITFDLPILNTNRGNINATKFVIEQESQNKQVLENSLFQTLNQLHNQLYRFETILDNWSATNNTKEQLELIDNYKKHLQNKQINLLEFLDFTEAFRQANQAYLEVEESYNNTFQEIQYLVGKDF